MSWQASTWALNLKLGNSTRKLVLMGYADHAHQDGKNAFIGVETVATYAECDKRTVQRHIRWLLEHGYMREGDQSLVSDFDPRYRPIVYELAMDDSTREQWEIDHASGGNARRAAAAAAGVKGGKATAKARGDNLSPDRKSVV